MAQEMKLYGGLSKAQLRAIEQAATPGPWWFQYEYDGSRTVCLMRSCDNAGACVNRAAHVEGKPYEATKENGALISAARNALPDLLADIERLEARIAAIEEQSAEEEIDMFKMFRGSE